jgi:hypothetical protein
MIIRREEYAPGDTSPAERLLAVQESIAPGLGANTLAVPASRATGAVLHYATENDGPHTWLVNGAPFVVASVMDAATALYCSDILLLAPVGALVGDEVIITVGGETITLEVI